MKTKLHALRARVCRESLKHRRLAITGWALAADPVSISGAFHIVF